MWPQFLVRTPGRAHKRLKRHRCTQARQSPPPDWCVRSGAYGLRSAPALGCLHGEFLVVGKFAVASQQHCSPKSPALETPSRTELGLDRTMHLRKTPQLFPAPAGRQSSSDIVPKPSPPRPPPHSTHMPPPLAPWRHTRCSGWSVPPKSNGAGRLGSGAGVDGGPSKIPGLERVGFVCRRGQGAPLTHSWAHMVPRGGVLGRRQHLVKALAPPFAAIAALPARAEEYSSG